MTISRIDVAGWILRCRPDYWDVDEARRRSPEPLPFSLQPTYRLALVLPGDPVFLFIGGSGRGSGGGAGVAAVGTVDGPPKESITSELWLNPEQGNKSRPYVSVQWTFLAEPIPRRELVDTWDLRHLELLRVPRALNPSLVRIGELRALQRLTSHAASMKHLSAAD